MINIYADQGRVWVQDLPEIISHPEKYWNVKQLMIVNTMSFHYVAKGYQDNMPVVIKIDFDRHVLCQEKTPLDYFDGHACIKILDYHDGFIGFLLQQALPGTSLKGYYPSDISYVIDQFSFVMKLSMVYHY